MVLGLCFQILVAKLLIPDDFAIYAVALAMILVGERVLSFGVDRTMLRFIPSLGTHSRRVLAKRLVFSRAVSIFILLGVLWLSWSLRLTPSGLGAGAELAFAIWFISFGLLTDGDAIAQSLRVHEEAAAISTLEIFGRSACVALLSAVSEVSALTVIWVCASTTCVAAVLFGFRLWRRALDLERSAADTVDLRSATSFTVSAYASTLAYIISSPPAVRLIAGAGLDLVTLAAFSFIQGISISLQRGLPGMLVLPTLETLVAPIAAAGREAQARAGLSLLLKAEIMLVSCVTVAVAAAGYPIVASISRETYAPYHLIAVPFMAGIVLHTSYRIIEIWSAATLRHRIFSWLWIISLCSAILMYTTIDRLGLLSILIFPLIDLILKILVLLFSFRKELVWQIFDPARNARVVFVTAGLVVTVASLKQLTTPGTGGLIGLAALFVLVFLIALTLVKPLRDSERDVLAKLVPSAPWIRKLLQLLSQ